MSRFFSPRHSGLTAYTPGEQPQDRSYIKLNTNESPYPPSPLVEQRVAKESARLHLYPDPECTALRERIAARYGVQPDNVLLTNGSDEILNYAFMAFAEDARPTLFPDITYGFYRVYAALHHLPANEIPLTDDLSIDTRDYVSGGGMVVLANPNAPTGRYLPPEAIERVVASDPSRVVLVDEAYIDFGGESVVPLTKRYDNLLVTRTFSKSRSMAGARLGFGVADAALIRDLNTLKYSVNPYTINRLTLAAGEAALEEDDYYRDACATVAKTREYTAAVLTDMGFSVIPSMANFVFAKTDAIGGQALYLALRERGILVRHFDAPRIRDYNRITIGTREQMDALLAAVRDILKEIG